LINTKKHIQEVDSKRKRWI